VDEKNENCKGVGVREGARVKIKDGIREKCSECGASQSQDFYDKILCGCMGISSTALKMPSRTNITLDQLQSTMHYIQALKTVYYITDKYIPESGKDGKSICFKLTEGLAKRWGAMSGLFVLLHPDLVDTLKERVQDEGFIFKEWSVDILHLRKRAFVPYDAEYVPLSAHLTNSKKKTII